jgi:DNA-binding NtrC family response regulator
MVMPINQRTVLVVEDDHLILLNARILLENAGLTVLVANDGVQALALLDERPEVSALFTDVVMPGPIDGVALAEEVSRRRPDIPVFITSGSPETAQRMLPPSASFLPKPYTANQLTRLLVA